MEISGEFGFSRKLESFEAFPQKETPINPGLTKNEGSNELGLTSLTRVFSCCFNSWIHLLFGKHFFYAMPARARYLLVGKQGFAFVHKIYISLQIGISKTRNMSWGTLLARVPWAFLASNAGPKGRYEIVKVPHTQVSINICVNRTDFNPIYIFNQLSFIWFSHPRTKLFLLLKKWMVICL